MRIGIDVRYLSHGLVGGVHAYVTHLITALLELGSSHAIFLYADTKRPFELTSLPNHVTLRLLPYRNPMSSIYYDFFLRDQMARDALDVAHFPTNYGFAPARARTVITLHDAINLLPLSEIIRGHPKNPRTIASMTYLHYLTRAAVRRADLILTVSQHAAREIAQVGKLDAGKIVAVAEAPAPDMRRIDDAQTLNRVRQQLEITCPFVLADALKNPAVLVKAWQLLPSDLRARKQIIFFSRRADHLPVIDQAVAAGYARLLVRPSREELMALYSMTEAFVFPSWIEGFGLPVLEAMACGAPVIASNRGSIPEVAGDAALLIDAEDAETLAHYLTLVLNMPLEAEGLRQRGYARAAQFSWENTARLVLDSYRGVLES